MTMTTSTLPLLLEGSRGKLVCFYYAPAQDSPFRGNLLVAPAFAEEMNRCRAMVSLQARTLAQAGVGTFVMDVFGTGDSEGEFSEASWAQWKADLKLGLGWLRQHAGGCNAMWGIRLGALMALEMAAEDPQLQRLLLWQPVTQGKQYWTQFLRIRIAAEMDLKDGVKSTEALRQLSSEGAIVEVSGYSVGSKLSLELDTLAPPAPGALAGRQLGWLEVLPNAEASPARASTKAVEALQSAGNETTCVQVVGPPFWQVHERELAPALIDATRDWIAGWPAQPGQVPVICAEAQVIPAGQARHPMMLACAGTTLSAIVHRGDPAQSTGVVIVVAGGPQFRVGAHRQFVSLAGRLTSQGYPVMRFDLRGMGDSSGQYLGYQQSRPDIKAAVDGLLRDQPQLQRIVLFGECESASGILFYAFGDPRISGIALVNPWVRTQEGQAEVILKHYYLDRLMSPKFWRDVRQGRFNPFRSLLSFVQVFRDYLRGRAKVRQAGPAGSLEDFDQLPLPVKTAEGLRRYRGPALILMSGRDYIAREFDEVTRSSKAWEGLLSQPQVLRKDIANADHTFSKAEWKAEAQQTLLDWLKTV